jgi:hypothetical protein
LSKNKLSCLRQFSISVQKFLRCGYHWVLTPATVEICTARKTNSYIPPSTLSCERYHLVPCSTTIPESNIPGKMDRSWWLHSTDTQITQSDTHGLSFWGFVKDNVYIPPMPENLQELCDRAVNAIALVHVTFLGKLWVELEYRLDVCCITRGSHTTHTSIICIRYQVLLAAYCKTGNAKTHLFFSFG